MACYARCIDTDNAQPTICRALHDLGNHVVKAKYRHATTIAVGASVHSRGERSRCEPVQGMLDEPGADPLVPESWEPDLAALVR